MAVFPAIGFELGKTELKNPSGFTSVNLFKVDEVGIDISLLGLMDHKLEIGEVRVEGAEVHIETLQDGSSNIDALTLKNRVSRKQIPAMSQSKIPQRLKQHKRVTLRTRLVRTKPTGTSLWQGSKLLTRYLISKINKLSLTPNYMMCSLT